MTLWRTTNLLPVAWRCASACDRVVLVELLTQCQQCIVQARSGRVVAASFALAPVVLALTPTVLAVALGLVG